MESLFEYPIFVTMAPGLSFKLTGMVSLLFSPFAFLKDRNIRTLTISSFVIIITGSLVYHFVEGWCLLDSIYFSAITLTTVGYGDFSPQTDFGKLFTVFYVLTGIGIIFGYINALYEYRRERIKKARSL